MKNCSTLNCLYSFILFSLFINFSSCKKITRDDGILELYINPESNLYRIDKIALLPMAKDDSTTTGTFFSTNYFYNKLRARLFSVKLTDINKILPGDSTIIFGQIESLKKAGKINLDTLFNSDFGYFLDDDTCDAIILGTVNEYRQYYYVWFSIYSQLFYSNVTECDFTYYMVSLFDGTILWKARVLGMEEYSEVFWKSNFRDEFLPLDYAISNGIDLLLEKFPLDLSNTQPVR